MSVALEIGREVGLMARQVPTQIRGRTTAFHSTIVTLPTLDQLPKLSGNLDDAIQALKVKPSQSMAIFSAKDGGYQVQPVGQRMGRVYELNFSTGDKLRIDRAPDAADLLAIKSGDSVIRWDTGASMGKPMPAMRIFEPMPIPPTA